MIDWSRVEELRSEIGAEDFGEIVDLFLSEVDGSISALEQDGGDARSVEETMHFLKGASLNLGFADLSALCAQGERAAAEGRPHEVSAMQVRACFEQSRAQFGSEYESRFAA